MNATPVFNETPDIAAAKAPVSGGVKAGKPNKPAAADFKEQLESCNEEAAVIAQMMPSGGDTTDNSSVTDSAAKSEQPGIVGILEGFGLLDYQTDTPVVPAKSAAGDPPVTGFMIAAQPAITEQPVTAELPRDAAQAAADMKGTGVFEQFARMLSEKQFSALPPKVRQQVLSEVQEYLGSLESTNKGKDAVAAPDKGAAMADVSGTPDSLLIRMKMAQQTVRTAPDAKPIQATDGETPAPAPNAPAPIAAAPTAAAQTAAAPTTAAPTAAAPTTAAPDTDIPIKVQGTAAQKPAPDDAPEPAAKQDSRRDGQPGVQGAAGGGIPRAAQSVPARAAAPEAPAKTDFVKDNVIRIVEKISAQMSEGKCDFDVALKPDFLGKVSIRLTLENGSIRMQIRTHDMGVKGMFTDQMPGLQSLLKDKGLAVAGIDVTYQSEASGGYEAYRQNGRQSGADQGGAKSGRNRYPQDWPAQTLYDAMAAPADYYLGGSSVEYLA